MFSVLFEVHPKSDQWDAYLGYARMLRPELERIEGFVDNIRYRSLTREGWILSLSGWRDEKALVRWRTQAKHHDVQEKGRFEVFLDYHLRVGEVTRDTRLPDGHALHQQRLDETETGEGTTVTLIDANRPPEWVKETSPDDVAKWLGLAPNASGLAARDVFHAVLTPGDIILLVSWRDQAAAEAFEGTVSLQDGARLRRVRVVRDYGMFDRREAPQYYPDVDRAADNKSGIPDSSASSARFRSRPPA
jgi:heme-degrading monooxygenase HmoA